MENKFYYCAANLIEFPKLTFKLAITITVGQTNIYRQSSIPNLIIKDLMDQVTEITITAFVMTGNNCIGSVLVEAGEDNLIVRTLI